MNEIEKLENLCGLDVSGFAQTLAKRLLPHIPKKGTSWQDVSLQRLFGWNKFDLGFAVGWTRYEGEKYGLLGEIDELKDALDKLGPDDIQDELLDVAAYALIMHQKLEDMKK